MKTHMYIFRRQDDRNRREPKGYGAVCYNFTEMQRETQRQRISNYLNKKSLPLSQAFSSEAVVCFCPQVSLMILSRRSLPSFRLCNKAHSFGVDGAKLRRTATEEGDSFFLIFKILSVGLSDQKAHHNLAQSRIHTKEKD